MRPLDPRLLRYARSTRGFIAIAVALGVITAGLVIVQAKLLSGVIVGVTAEGLTWDDAVGSLTALAIVFAVRALIAWLAELAAFRSSARAKQELREATLAHVLALGPYGPAGADRGALSTLITRGVDGLDGYFARYLPQLFLAVIVPVAVLATVLGQDLLSAFIIAITLPLIPVFMALIGLYTKARVDRQWRVLSQLSGHFLDLIAGLPTLKLFGRAQAQARAIRAIGDDYRSATMSVLRISFLSSLALELLASLSVALVAVSVGLRLAEGQIQYGVALFVLVLAPEAYLPLRLVGQHFHAAAEGLGAAERMLELLEMPVPEASGARTLPGVPVALDVRGVAVELPGRAGQALEPASFTAHRGDVVALVGPSGGGKTTLLNTLLGFRAPVQGEIVATDDQGEQVSLADLDMNAWRSHVGWVPQRAHLVGDRVGSDSTVREVVRAGRPTASDEDIERALRTAGLGDEFTRGLDTMLRADGSGVSMGQAQRLALARALVRQPALLLLDEPTAALDGRSEAAVVAAVRSAADAGAMVVVVAHRPALVAIADVVVRIGRDVDTAATPATPQPSDEMTTTLRGPGW